MTGLAAGLRRIALAMGAAMIAVAGLGGGTMAQSYDDMTLEELRADITEHHPVAYYILAVRLLEDDPDEAVFWFYAGQLRYRVLLSCESAGGADEGILFNALSESVGRPMNEYAFGDIDTLVATIDEVLVWDDENDSLAVPKADCADAFSEVRAGLVSLRDEIVANADDIRYQRTQNGLENRT